MVGGDRALLGERKKKTKKKKITCLEIKGDPLCRGGGGG